MRVTMRPIFSVVCVLCLFSAKTQAVNVGSWMWGRSTHYGGPEDSVRLSMGSCMYGYLDANKCTGWDIGALSDQNPEFNWADKSCGRCYEVKCVNAKFQDGYNQEIDRSNVCYDQSASVIVMITDMCPCHYPNNAYSNTRWCCGDHGPGMAHMDLSIWAYEKLSDPKKGVMRTKFRRVPCDHTPSKRAQIPSGLSPTPSQENAPWGWTGDKRPCPIGARPTANRRPTTKRTSSRPGAKKTKSNMSIGIWSFSKWSSQGVTGGTAAVCGSMYAYGGVTLNGKLSGKKAVEFWVRREGGNLPKVVVKGSGKGCKHFDLSSLNRSEEKNGYVKYYLNLSMFKCRPKNIIIQNTEKWGTQSICVDGPLLH